MKKLLPLIFLLIGAGAGVGAGVFLRPPPPPIEAEAETDGETAAEEKPKEAEEDDGEPPEYEYVKLSNQFVIPIVQSGAVASMVVMSLTVEVKAGFKDQIYNREPKLRDSFLQVLFDHANVGGFRGEFTSASNLAVLRAALKEIAVRDGGDIISDVLILEIARQDY